MEIERSMSRSGRIIDKVQAFYNEYEKHVIERENFERMKNMRIVHRGQDAI